MQLKDAFAAYMGDFSTRCMKDAAVQCRLLAKHVSEGAGEREAESIGAADMRRLGAMVKERSDWGASAWWCSSINLMTMFHWFVEEGYITENPCRGLRKPTFR